MKRLVALFLIVLAVAAFATTASAKARTEWIFDNAHVQGSKAP